MSQPVEIQVLLERIDKDVRAIYELLGEIKTRQQEHGDALADHARQLTQVSGAQQRQYDRLERQDLWMYKLTRQVDEIQKVHDRHGGYLDGIDIRLERIDGNLNMIVGQPETEQAQRPSPEAAAQCE